MNGRNSRATAEESHHRELLARSAGGSREAFGQLYDLLYLPLARFIYRYHQSEAVIEEVLNDTMLVVWQKAGTFRGDSRVMTWVFGIASRRALKAVQRERGWRGVDRVDPETRPSPGETGQLAVREALEWGLGQLATEQRLAIELAYFHGMSCAEMAQIMDCPENTAKTRLFHGRKRLHAVFTGGEPELDFNDLIDDGSFS